jgi:hypothetical protein
MPPLPCGLQEGLAAADKTETLCLISFPSLSFVLWEPTTETVPSVCQVAVDWSNPRLYGVLWEERRNCGII